MQDASKMPKRMALFIRKMESNGFQMKRLDVKLSSAEKQECLANGTRAKQMGYILKAYYKFRSFFKDEMKGTYFPENIYVFNRNQDGEQSNFFVFARWNWSRGIELMYSNPLSPEKGGTKLKKNDIVIQRLSGLAAFGLFDKWAETTIDEIRRISEYKAKDKFYAQMHGHWGFSRRKLLMDLGIDDGKSHEISVIMSLMFWHTDFDATGCHNNHFGPLFDDIQRLENAVGMVKVPAVEVTMPICLYDDVIVDAFIKRLKEMRKRLDIPDSEEFLLSKKEKGGYKAADVWKILARYEEKIAEYNSSPEGVLNPLGIVHEANGPHVMLYAANTKIMGDIQRIHLSKRELSFPSLASELEMEEFMFLVSEIYGDKVAMMMTHPACSQSLPSVGILNRVYDEEISLEEAERITMEYTQAVGAFNPTVSRKERFRIIPNSILEVLEKYGPENCAPTLNAANLAWAKKLNQEQGMPMVFDGDAHFYLMPEFGKQFIGIPGFGRTVFEGNISMDAEGFVKAMHDAKAGLFSIYPEIFMEWATDRIGEQYPRIVREREANTFQETIEGIRKSIRVYGIHGVPKLLKDVYTSVSTQNPSSINEFLHALTRIYR